MPIKTDVTILQKLQIAIYLSVCFFVHFLSASKENEPKKRRIGKEGLEKSNTASRV